MTRAGNDPDSWWTGWLDLPRKTQVEARIQFGDGEEMILGLNEMPGQR